MPRAHGRCPECRALVDKAGPCAACARKRYTERRHVYASKEWKQRLRPQVLSEEPVCRLCGAPSPTEVDHIEDIAARPHLALERSNLQALCVVCHGRKTRRES